MKKPEEVKKVTPKCPWCGAEMRFDADSIHVWFKCDNCLAASPKAYRIWDTGLKTAENWAVNESIALDRIQQLEAQVPRWISVEERLPEGEDPVLILVKETEHYGLHKEKSKVYYCQYLAYWDDEEWYTTWCNGCRKITDTANEPNADDYEVTHWMPLPEAPKEDAQ